MKPLRYIGYSICAILMGACHTPIKPSVTLNKIPPLFPDYVGVTVPSTIAPLSFKVMEDYTAIDLEAKGCQKGDLHVQATKYISIEKGKWAELLASNQGDSIKMTVSVEQEGRWKQFAPFYIYVSNYGIDYGLAYRLIAPGYEVYSKMGIYQRNLSNYAQQAIIENTLVPGSCINCHSFKQTNAKQMNIHMRGKNGGTILMNNNKLDFLNTRTDSTISNCVYPYWHPSGEYIVYSVNKTQQVFHEIKTKRVEVVDLESDLVVYHLPTNQLISCDLIKTKGSFETFPSFSPDGKRLYFCSAKQQQLPNDYNKIRYNLCAIDFNPDNGTFGTKIDTLVNAEKMNKSISFPRPSYDGKYLMYTLFDYGNFSIWHKEADLWLLDLKTGQTRPITEVNSNDVESYHSWSSNSHWFVFSSRRIDGLYTRPFIASIDDNGKVTKPFLLPQSDPDFYDRLLFSFNIPEFINGEVELDINEVEEMAHQAPKQVAYK
jgi:hypothetical protein